MITLELEEGRCSSNANIFDLEKEYRQKREKDSESIDRDKLSLYILGGPAAIAVIAILCFFWRRLRVTKRKKMLIRAENLEQNQFNQIKQRIKV